MGHEVGAHGYYHRFVYRQTPDEFRAEVLRTKDILEGITGCNVAGFRAPYFSITASTLWALDVLAELGFTYDSSIFPIHNHRYGIPQAKRTPHRIACSHYRCLVEFPISTIRILGTNYPFSGGIYFRLLRHGWIARGITSLNRQEWPAVVYLHPWEKAVLLAPIVRDRKGEYRKELDALLRDGFVRARVDGEIVELKPGLRLERYKRHTIEAVMDRLVVGEGARGRVAEAVERALDMGQGFMTLLVDGQERTFSRFLHCVECGIDLPELEPRLFSFNSPRGACERCGGLGVTRAIDPRKVVVVASLSISDGALGVMTKTRMKHLTFAGVRVDELADLVPVDVPWKKLSQAQRDLVMNGAKGAFVRRRRQWAGKDYAIDMSDRVEYKGILPSMEVASYR